MQEQEDYSEEWEPIISQEEYSRRDNRVTGILQQRWPANEISLWVGLLQGKQHAVACAILRRRHPLPA